MAPFDPAPTTPVRSATAEAVAQSLAAEGPNTATRRALLGAAGALGGAAVALGIARLPGTKVHAQVVAPPPAALAAAAPSAATVAPENALRIPPLLAPEAQNGVKTFDLLLQQGEFQFVPGQPVATLGINGSYLGPTLRAKQGDAVSMRVANHIGEETTLHWHGMHLPAIMDGGPHQLIADGGEWNPRFIIQQQAATLWFHSHLMGKTREQVTRGLAGMFILDDDDPAQDALPHTYGVDDLPLIFQDLVFDGRNGFGGGVPTLLNGSIAPSFVTAQPRLRLRLLNATSQRLFAFGFGDDRTFYQVAGDGGLLPAPVPLTRLQLGPAERAEIVVDLAGVSGAPGANGDQAPQTALLQSFRGPNGAAATTVLTITSTADPAQVAALARLPAQLNAIDRLPPETAAVTRDMVLAGNGAARTINGHAMASMDDMHDMAGTVRVRVGDVEVWNVINTTRQMHLFHVHGLQYQVVDRSRPAPAANEAGWKDTVVVRPGETVRIIMRFADFADSETPYMFHCHILQHEDQGMMGQYVVVPA